MRRRKEGGAERDEAGKGRVIERRSKGRGCNCNEGKRDEKGKARRKDQKHLDIWSFERTKIRLHRPKERKEKTRLYTWLPDTNAGLKGQYKVKKKNKLINTQTNRLT